MSGRGFGATFIAVQRCTARTKLGIPATRGCFTRCFTRAQIGRTPRHGPRHRPGHTPRRRLHDGPRHRPGTNSTSIPQRPQVVAGCRQGRHVAHGHLHDAGNRRGRSVRVTQACAPRRTVGASTTHRHRRRPHRHQHAARSHGHRQVAARIGGVPLRDAAQVEARAGNIHTTDGLGGNAHCPAPLAHTRQQATGRRPHRRLHNTSRRRRRQGPARNIRRPHRLDIPCGDKRADHWVERSPGRLRERQRVTQQPVGVLAHDEAGASHSGIEPRDLGRNPENAPQVLVARHDLDDGVDDCHAVPAPADDVDAGAHRGKRGTPHRWNGRYGRTLARSTLARSIPSVPSASDTGRPSHGLVPRAAHRARGTHGTRGTHRASAAHGLSSAQLSEPSTSPSLVESFRPGMLMSSAPSGETPCAAAMARMAACTNCW